MTQRLHLATPGTVYTIRDKKLVEQLIATGNFVCIRTNYLSHKWWQFWKYKKITSYEVMCIKDLKY